MPIFSSDVDKLTEKLREKGSCLETLKDKMRTGTIGDSNAWSAQIFVIENEISQIKQELSMLGVTPRHDPD